MYDVAFSNSNVYDSSIVTPIYIDYLQAIVDIIFYKIEDLKVSGYLMKAIFDPLINPNEVYTSNGLNVTYDEIDIIYKSYETLESIMAAGFANYSLSSDGAVFMQQYLTPSMSQLILQCSQRI
jgi:hypothetical protein